MRRGAKCGLARAEDPLCEKVKHFGKWFWRNSGGGFLSQKKYKNGKIFL